MIGDSLSPWLERWSLAPDGPAFATASSRLMPVRTPDGRAAMLKLAVAAEERFGAGLMIWWAGDGAAEVLAADGPALLLARAGGGSLLDLWRQDEAGAAAVLAPLLDRLHAPRAGAPEAIPLARRCAALARAAGREGGLFAPAAARAQALLDNPQGCAVLHGDAHPANVLDFGGGDWRVIDPKRLRGEPAFDHVAPLVTPDLPASPEALDRRLAAIATASGRPGARLLAWAEVAAALSAVWSIEDGDDPSHALGVAGWAAARLSR